MVYREQNGCEDDQKQCDEDRYEENLHWRHLDIPLHVNCYSFAAWKNNASKLFRAAQILLQIRIIRNQTGR